MNINNINSGSSIVSGLNSISCFQEEKGRDKNNDFPVVSNPLQLSSFKNNLKINKITEANKICNEDIEFIFYPCFEDLMISSYYSQYSFYNWMKVIGSITERDFKKGEIVNIIV